MKTTHLYRLFAGVICISILLAGCYAPPKPDTSGEISDIRMRVVQVVNNPDTGEPFANDSDTVFLRIYYGYYKNGKWFDYPSEYYELKSIFTSEQYTDYYAAGENHIVKIGPYLLISIVNNSFMMSDEVVPVEITDTLGSEVQQMFSEYYSSPFSGSPYGYVKEEWHEKNAFFNNSENFSVNVFGRYYYIVLEYDTLTDDYALQYTTRKKGEMVTQTLTYEQIKQLIEG